MAAGRFARRSDLAAGVHQGVVAGPAGVILKLVVPSERYFAAYLVPVAPNCTNMLSVFLLVFLDPYTFSFLFFSFLLAAQEIRRVCCVI